MILIGNETTFINEIALTPVFFFKKEREKADFILKGGLKWAWT
jgi:hypothetical protein